MNNNLVRELLTTVRTGKNGLVRENALDLLYKLAADGDRGARGAIRAIERSRLWQCREGQTNSQGAPAPKNG